MRINDLKQFLTNRINNLELRLSSAMQSGDVELYAVIEKELTETKESLFALDGII